MDFREKESILFIKKENITIFFFFLAPGGQLGWQQNPLESQSSNSSTSAALSDLFWKATNCKTLKQAVKETTTKIPQNFFFSFFSPLPLQKRYILTNLHTSNLSISPFPSHPPLFESHTCTVPAAGRGARV